MNEIAKTVNMFLEVMMKNEDPNGSFDYEKPVILEESKIIIVPTDSNCDFVDAWICPEFVTEEIIEGNTKKFGINFSVNVELFDTENDNFYLEDINELGEIVIKLDANQEDQEGSAKFIEPIIMNIEAQLEEAVDEVEDNAEEEEVDIESVTAEVITEDALEDTENMTSWVVTYDLKEVLTEDANEEVPSNVDIIEAPDIETAVKYAEQSARIKAKEDSRWSDAEITSIKKKSNKETV